MKATGIWRVGLVLVLLVSFGVVRRTAQVATVTVDTTDDISDGNTTSTSALIAFQGLMNPSR